MPVAARHWRACGRIRMYDSPSRTVLARCEASNEKQGLPALTEVFVMRPYAVALKSIIAGLLVAMTLVTTASAVERNPARTRPAAATEQATTQRIIVKFRQSS